MTEGLGGATAAAAAAGEEFIVEVPWPGNRVSGMEMYGRARPEELFYAQGFLTL